MVVMLGMQADAAHGTANRESQTASRNPKHCRRPRHRQHTHSVHQEQHGVSTAPLLLNFPLPRSAACAVACAAACTTAAIRPAC